VKLKIYLLAALIATATALSPLASAQAQKQELQPAVVFSVTPVENIFKDVAYLSEAAGQPDMGRLLVILSAGYTVGIDKTRPAGGYLTFDGNNPVPVTFIPVTDLKKALATHRATIGEAKEIEGGILELENDNTTLYIKEKDGYAFVTQEKENLAVLPKNAAEMVGALAEEYTIAVQLNVQNIPADLRKLAVTEIKAAFERELENQAGDNDDKDAAAVREKLGRNTVEQFTELIENSDQVTIGWAVDPEAKVTYLDVSATAIKGTKLARQMASLQNQTTLFGGFLLEDSAVNFNLTGEMTPQDVEQLLFMLNTGRDRAIQEVEEDDDLNDDKKRDEAKRIIGEMFDVVEASVKTGKLDGGAVLLLGDQSMRFAAGSRVAKGKELERALRDLVKLADGDPEFPTTKLNIGKHKGVVFHGMEIDIPADEADAREIFGKQLDVTIGLSESSIYLALGDGGVDLLKQVIDKSAASANDTVSPMRMTISLGPILEFASQFDDNPFTDGAVEALKDVRNRDHIIITSTPIKRGSKTRIEIENGVLTILGKGFEAMNERGGF